MAFFNSLFPRTFIVIRSRMRRAATVRREPERWLPWNWQDAAAGIETSTKTATAQMARPATRTHRKLTIDFSESTILNGGAYGLEASILSIIAALTTISFIWLGFVPRGAREIATT